MQSEGHGSGEEPERAAVKNPAAPLGSRLRSLIMRWKWGNIPIPESYVLALVAGAVLQFLKPYAITTAQWLVRVLGVPLLLAGLVLAGWSVVAAGEVSLEKPTVLLTSGLRYKRRVCRYL